MHALRKPSRVSSKFFAKFVAFHLARRIGLLEDRLDHPVTGLGQRGIALSELRNSVLRSPAE